MSIEEQETPVINQEVASNESIDETKDESVKQEVTEEAESIVKTVEQKDNENDQQDTEQESQPQSEEASQEQEQKPVEQESTQEPKETTPILATEGGREVSHSILYVGGLEKSISEESLKEIFSVDGLAQSVKILADKNRPGFNYAFIEYEDEKSTNAAFTQLNGSLINGSEIRINWAYQSQQAKNDPNSYNIFVGDLSSEVNDDLLKKSFEKFPSLLQAHVMWDMQSGRSRGYGFISFGEQEDAETALKTMNGELIANRSIRLNWASHKQNLNGNGYRNQYGHHHHHNNHHHHHHHNNNHHNNNNNHQHNNHNGIQNSYVNYPQTNLINGVSNFSQQQQQQLTQQQQQQQLTQQQSQLGSQQINGSIQSGVQSPINGSSIHSIGVNGIPIATSNVGSNSPNLNGAAAIGINLLSPQSYDLVLRKAPSWQTTVYLGNLARFTTQNDLIPLLQNFGFIVDLRFLPEKNCAFVKYDSHERAALAIVQLNGFVINGRPLKSGWGKDRSQNLQYQNYGPIVYGQGR